VSFPGFADSLTASYDAGTTQVFGDLGYRIDMGEAFGGTAFEPFVNLAYVHLTTDGFAESGGAAALSGRSKDTSTTFTTLGVRASAAFDLGSVTVNARGSLGWRHAFGDDTPLATLAFFGGNPFTIAGVPIAKDAAVLDLGLDVGIMENVTLGLSYGGQFATDAVDQSVRGNLSVKF
jgi:outer membrane autotransporter protein